VLGSGRENAWNCTIGWGLPSSSTTKSSRVRPARARRFSVAVTSIRTTSTLADEIVGMGGASGFGAGCDSGFAGGAAGGRLLGLSVERRGCGGENTRTRPNGIENENQRAPTGKHGRVYQLSAVGTASENGAISASNCRPPDVTILVGPLHRADRRRQRAEARVLEALARLETGCSPTTPGPCTSSTRPSPSVMIQCRLTSWTVSSPTFEMRMR
jgi:hypothetical protein